MIKKVEISHKTIIFTFIFLISLWTLYFIREIILQLFVALLIMAILDPFVTRLSKYKIPRTISVLVSYLILFTIISFSVAAIIPPLIDQTGAFITNLPKFMNNVGFSSFLSDQIMQQLISQLVSLPGQIAKLTVSVFSNVLALIAVLVMAFYLLSERNKLEEQLGSFIGEKKKIEAVKMVNLLEAKLGNWARAQMSLMLVVGMFSFIGLVILGIPYAIPLSILAGVLEIVPFIGPILSAVPAVLIGLGISPILGLAAAALYFLVQQLENHLFVPKIMQKSTGVNPVVTLLCLAIGFKFAGVVGLLISVPVFITLQIVVQRFIVSSESGKVVKI